ncbi:MAG: hypothetical protein RLZZ337_163 [Bacteroidota bacterium]|jgi:biotin transport system substrate-specific component
MLTNTSNNNKIFGLRQLLITVAFLFLLILGAKIDLNLGGKVSFTLQTLVLGIAYYFLSKRWRLALIFIYLTLGIMGISVFNSGAGWDYFISWPLGFFIGFLVAALLPTTRDNSSWPPLIYFLFLHAIIIVLGACWIAVYTNSTQNGIETLIELLPGVFIKSGVGAALIWLWQAAETRKLIG